MNTKIRKFVIGMLTFLLLIAIPYVSRTKVPEYVFIKVPETVVVTKKETVEVPKYIYIDRIKEIRGEEIIKTVYVSPLEVPAGYIAIEATGYSANDPEQGTNNINALGRVVREGTVAACPSQFPLGSRIDIYGLGEYVVEDTGGAITHGRIDIFFDTKQEALDWGRRTVYVKLLEGS